MGQITNGSTDYAVDSELLQEVLHIFHSRRDTDRGIQAVNRLLALFPDVIPIASGEIRAASQILAQYTRLSSRDAVHAAVVQTQGLEGIVTTDRVFRSVRAIRAFDPRELLGDTG